MEWGFSCSAVLRLATRVIVALAFVHALVGLVHFSTSQSLTLLYQQSCHADTSVLPAGIGVRPKPGSHVTVGEFSRVLILVRSKDFREPAGPFYGYASWPTVYIDDTRLTREARPAVQSLSTYRMTERLGPGLHRIRVVFPEIQQLSADSIQSIDPRNLLSYEDSLEYEWEFCADTAVSGGAV